MGIEWIGSYCDGTTTPHHLIEIDKIDGQSIMLCKKCLRPKVQPASLEVSQRFTALLKLYKLPDGYHAYLDSYKEVKSVVVSIQRIWKDNREVLSTLLEEK